MNLFYECLDETSCDQQSQNVAPESPPPDDPATGAAVSQLATDKPETI